MSGSDCSFWAKGFADVFDLCTGPNMGDCVRCVLCASGTPMGTVSAQVFGLEIRVKNMTTNATT